MVLKTRKRKQNKNEDVNSCSSEESSPEKATGIPEKKNDGHQLKNMLNLAKARKWTAYEWVYSDIDARFFTENNFKDLLSTLFPRLKVPQLTMVEWRKIRSLMVKDSQYRLRRCSSVFFHDERVKLERCRQKYRLIKMFENDITESNTITLPSNLGASVTIFSKNTDFDIKCGTLQEAQSEQNNYKIKITDGRIISASDFEFCASDDGMQTIQLQNYVENLIGNFPEGLLKTIVTFQKVLELKREKIKLIRNLISTAKNCTVTSIEQDFVSGFLNDFILDLETLNSVIAKSFETLKNYKIVQGFLLNAPTSDAPIHFREKSTKIISEQLELLTHNNFHPSVMHLIQILSSYAYILIECDKLAANQYRWLDQFLFEHLEQLKNSIQCYENIDVFNDKVIPIFNILINNCVQNKV